MSDGTLNFPLRNSPPSAPSTGRVKLWVDSLGNPKSTDSTNTTKGFESVYGSEFSIGSESTIQAIASLSYSTYLDLVANTSALGSYRIEINFRYSINNADVNLFARLLVNGSPVNGEFIKRVRSTTEINNKTLVFYIPSSGVTSPTTNLQLQFKLSVTWTSAQIYGATIAIHRVN